MDTDKKPQPTTLMELLQDDRITREQREFLTLRYLKNLPENEVASQMQKTPGQCQDLEESLMRGLRSFRRTTH